MRRLDSKNHNYEAVKLWSILVDYSFNGKLIFTRAEEKTVFPVKHHNEPMSWSLSAGLFQTIKWGSAEVIFS